MIYLSTVLNLKNMKLSLIFAQSLNGIIGDSGKIPWSIPENMAHFKRHTMHHPVIMGRKTWDSLPQSVKPLPSRPNLILSRQAHFSAHGASVHTSIEDAIQHCFLLPCRPQEVWCIGGSEIYSQAIPFASKIIRTTVHIELAGDTHAPFINDAWRLTKITKHTSINGPSYTIEEFVRH
jgi:dihydrofolate reductase